MAEFEKTSIDETINNFIKYTQGKKYKTIYADPPWQFQNRTGKVAPEHKRLNRYPTMKLEDIMKLPVGDVADEKSHLYLWVPNALLPEGLQVMEAWGFEYKTNLIWEKTRKDGEPDGRGVGFYFSQLSGTGGHGEICAVLRGDSADQGRVDAGAGGHHAHRPAGQRYRRMPASEQRGRAVRHELSDLRRRGRPAGSVCKGGRADA